MKPILSIERQREWARRRTRYGLTLLDAEEKAFKLAQGMTQDDVLSLLGKPDETGTEKFKPSTGGEWDLLMYYYRWPMVYSIWDKNPQRQIEVAFKQREDGIWILRRWFMFSSEAQDRPKFHNVVT
jgi:hypothetical protein